MPDRNLRDIISDAKQQSVKPLFPYLKVHIFGPYEGDCFAYLTQLKIELRKYGFKNTYLATDRGTDIPDELSDEEKVAIYRQEANSFLNEADVGIFLNLDHTFDRPSLSDQALAQSHDPDDNPREVNNSVSSEIEYWVNNRVEQHAFVLAEESIYPDLGSRVTGLKKLNSVHFDTVEDQNISECVTKCKKRCFDWVLGDFQSELWQRSRHG